MITKTKRQKRRKNPVLESIVDEILTELKPSYVMYLAEGDYSEIFMDEPLNNLQVRS